MKLDVPVLNDDGSVRFTAVLTQEQIQVLLQFALNFTIATGIAHQYGIAVPEINETLNPSLND